MSTRTAAHSFREMKRLHGVIRKLTEESRLFTESSPLERWSKYGSSAYPTTYAANMFLPHGICKCSGTKEDIEEELQMARVELDELEIELEMTGGNAFIILSAVCAYFRYNLEAAEELAEMAQIMNSIRK